MKQMLTSAFIRQLPFIKESFIFKTQSVFYLNLHKNFKRESTNYKKSKNI